MAGGVIAENMGIQLLSQFCDTAYNVGLISAIVLIIVCIVGLVKDKTKLTKDSLAILSLTTALTVLTYTIIDKIF